MAERVIKAHGFHVSGGAYIGGNAIAYLGNGFHPNNPGDLNIVEALMNDKDFSVYTTSEVDSFRHELQQKAAENAELIRNTGDKLQQAEARLREEVINSINDIPQKILSDKAIQDIKEAVLMELRIKLKALEQNFQLQIDEIKQKLQ